MLVKNIGGKESVSLPPEDRTGRAMAWNLEYCIKGSVDGSTLLSLGFSKGHDYTTESRPR